MDKTFQEQLTAVRRQQIIEAAIDVIAEQGFQRTTIKQIAARAGIADGTIYNYFKNKDAILMAIMGMLSEAEMREIDFAEAQKVEFDQFVSSYVAHRMEELAAGHNILKVVMPETIMNAELGKNIYEQIYTPGFVIAENYFQHLMEKGEMAAADPVVMARMFASPLLGLLLMRLMGDQHVIDNWDTYTEKLVQLLLTIKGNDNES